MLRVLVVEDEASSAEVAAIICRTAGYQADIASDGRAAWSAIQSDVYDLLLVDLRMPYMDGLTLLTLMRQDVRFASIPVLVVTARVTASDRHALAELNVLELILKPYSTHTLREAIQAALASCRVEPVDGEKVRIWRLYPQTHGGLE
jgi:DNA-binding response OmpR family regulator